MIHLKDGQLTEENKEVLQRLSIEKLGREGRNFLIVTTDDKDVFKVECDGIVIRTNRFKDNEDIDYIGSFYIDKDFNAVNDYTENLSPIQQEPTLVGGGCKL